jgi:hypothetical protein
MELPKDIYMHLTNFADDKTILNMLSVNKKFNDPNFFEEIVKKRHPTIIQYKIFHETWKDFYIEQIYWISKIKEDFNFDPLPYMLPKRIYKELKENSIETTKKYIDKKNHILYLSLLRSLKRKDVDSIEKLVQKGANLKLALSRFSKHDEYDPEFAKFISKKFQKG